MNENQAIGLLVIILVVLVVVFIVTRVFWLWYWKIFEVVSLLKQIRDSLGVLERASVVRLAAPPQVYAPAPTAAAPTAISTPEQGRRVRASRQSVLRTEADPNAEITGRVESGAWLNVLTAQPGWIWIQTDDGAEGWLQLPGQLT